MMTSSYICVSRFFSPVWFFTAKIKVHYCSKFLSPSLISLIIIIAPLYFQWYEYGSDRKANKRNWCWTVMQVHLWLWRTIYGRHWSHYIFKTETSSIYYYYISSLEKCIIWYLFHIIFSRYLEVLVMSGVPLSKVKNSKWLIMTEIQLM